MTPELWDRLKPLFHAAMEKDASSRAGFVEQACGPDAELKRQLFQLVEAAQEDVTSFDLLAVNLNAHSSDSRKPFRPGEIILGRFKIIRLLGRGGMGEVFEAQDLELGRIALKTIRPDLSTSARALERFRHEVQLARKITGPQVCRIHELFVLPSENGSEATAFLTMEYLDGVTLARRIRQFGPLPRKDALSIALDICEGLRAIHSQNIVHRDLKSANIMLCRRDGLERAVAMDFGLARDETREAPASDGSTVSVIAPTTAAGAIAGTPAYMAPEQFEGRPVSAATDIYALGVVLYEMVTGLHPYEADTPVGAAIRRARPRAPASSLQRGLPRHWDRVIERCLAWDPKQRFQSAEEVARALRASPASPGNLRRDHPWLVPGVAVVALAALAWGLVVWWQMRQYYRPSAAAFRLYQAGVADLREASYLKATRALEAATREDNRFVMAHARLAEAWSNLDFDGAAQREMLVATTGEGHLPPLDHMYLGAIRATLTRDYPSALHLYQQILDRLPDSEKSAGYVDLGLAYEHASDPQNALQSYQRASALDPDNPAPWLRTGMVATRLNQSSEAAKAFDRSEMVYREGMNPEGEAELNYQRGYLTGVKGGDPAAAVAFLQRSIDEAKGIASIPLQVRALTQLSSVECASGMLSEAVDHASEAVQLARQHQQEMWAAMSLARLANARLHQGDDHYTEAENALNEARNLAMQTQQGRALALANVVLASLRDQQGRPEDVVGPASDALRYYRQNGYFEPAAGARLLLLRSEASREDLRDLLKNSLDFLSLARSSQNPYLLDEAEFNLARAYEALQQYPDALTHYQAAMKLATSESTQQYQVIGLATAFAQLGRFKEAASALSIATKNRSLQVSVAKTQADSLLMQASYRAARDLTEVTIRQHPDMLPEDRKDLQRQKAVADAHLGRAEQAVRDIAAALPSNAGNQASRSAALQQCQVMNLAGQSAPALRSAAGMIGQFKAQGQFDSALQAALLGSAAARSLHDDPTRDRFAKESVDILGTLQHNWGDSYSHTYLSRPDMQILLRSAALPNWSHAK